MKRLLIAIALCAFAQTVCAQDALKEIGDLLIRKQSAEARTRIVALRETYRAAADAHKAAACTMLLGVAETGLGDHAGARSHLSEAADELVAAGDPLLAWLSVIALATYEKQQGQFDESLRYQERALEILEKGATSTEPLTLDGFKLLAPVFGFSTQDLGPLAAMPQVFKPFLLGFMEMMSRDSYAGTLMELGRFDDAEAQIQRAMEMSATYMGMYDAPLQWRLGDLRQRQWRLDEAHDAYRKAFEHAADLPATPIRDEWIEVGTLGGLATVDVMRGRIDDALVWNDKALKLVRDRHNEKQEASVLDDRATLLMHANRLDDARTALMTALDIGTQRNDMGIQAQEHAQLCSVDMFQGKYGSAATHCVKSIEIYQHLQEPFLESGPWAILAEVYFLLGNDESARQAVQKGRELATSSRFGLGVAVIDMLDVGSRYMNGHATRQELEKAFETTWTTPGSEMLSKNVRSAMVHLAGIGEGEGPSEVADFQVLSALTSFLRARALLSRGETRDARKVLEESLAKNDNRDHAAGYLALIGATWLKEGNAAEAVQYFEKSAATLQMAVDDVRVEELLAGYLGSSRRVYFDLLIDTLIHEHCFDEAFEQAERARARAFLQLIGNHRLRPSHGADADLVREAEALRNEISGMEKGTMPVPQGTSLDEARRRYRSLLTRVKVSNPEYEAITNVQPLTVSEARQQLDDDTTLVTYYASATGKVYAWVLDRNHFDAITLPVDREQWQRIVCWSDQVATSGTTRSGRPRHGCVDAAASPEEAYDGLVRPLRDHIFTSRLIIVPHAELHYVPFAALLDRDTGRYLLDDFTITHAPSVSALRFLREKETPIDGSALVLGNPNGGLNGAEREAVAVARRFQVKPLIGAAATESSIRSLGGKFDLIHLAAHGAYDAGNPLFSEIALARDATQDGDLSVDEILSDVDLAGVNLVVLSACSTARGERSGGDEIVGLTRALLYAGTPGVISTLWDISDSASTVLMNDFYERLTRGVNVADALREAQLTLRNSSNAAERDPKNWAAFVVNGDPRGRWQLAH